MPEWEIRSRDMLNFVEVELNDESIRTEAGAMRYYHGDIEMVSKLPTVGGFIKSKLSGEKIFRPVYTGTGRLMLEPSFQHFFELELYNESYVLDRGGYWASDMGVQADIKMNNISTSMLSGEGMIQTAVSGTGTVIVRAPGPVEIIDMINDQLVVDGSFAVARSSSLEFTIEQSTRSLFGTVTSGEALVNVLRGTGRVYLAPVPNQTLMLQKIITSSMRGMMAEFNAKQDGG